MKTKKATIGHEETMGLILAVMAFVALLFLAWTLFGAYNKTDEGTTSYFESFTNTIQKTEETGKETFSMWYPNTETKQYYLVYFGTKNAVTHQETDFITTGNPQNRACLCTITGEKGEETTTCNACKNLEKPLLQETTETPFVLTQGETIEITKTNEAYNIKKL